MFTSENNKLQPNTPPLGRSDKSAGGPELNIKVCGMIHTKNIQELANLKLDFIGFIFYKKSKRYSGDELDSEILNNLPKTIKKVGVFVNETEQNILQIAKKYNLDYLQLHGEETPEFCRNLQEKGLKIIKAFSVDESFDFDTTNSYNFVADFFLFDTKTIEKGGSGQTFDWQILKKYIGNTPFLLAGGIDEYNFEKAKDIKHPMLFGLDLNSKFEIEHGLKDIEKLRKVLTATPV